MPCEPCDCSIQQGLFAIPTADVVEVRHGKWRCYSFDPQDPYFTCSNCGVGYSTIYHEGVEMKYCPDCGAKMDRKGDGE